MKYLIFIISLLILSSCSKPEENYIKIPSVFTAAIQEEIKSSGERFLWLELSSMNSGYCQNDSLVYNASFLNNLVSIEILDSYKANDCLQRNYFLKSRIKLPDFSDSLNIQLSLGSASVVNCTVYNNKNYYNIEINNGTGLTSKYPRTYKIPSNLLWGYAYPLSFEPTSDAYRDNFINEIYYECITTSSLPEGYYSYFSISNYKIQLNESPGIAGRITNFYYFHDKTEEQLSQFIYSLASKYVNLVGFKINSGTGKEFKSY